MKEEWRDVKGFEGIYQISNKGRLKSFKAVKEGKIMSIKNKTGWYLGTVLTYKNKRKSIKIHQLVCEHFYGETPKHHNIHHIDGNKQNNHISNLSFVNTKLHSSITLKENPGMLNGMHRYNKLIKPRVVMQFSLEGKFIQEFQNAKEAERATKVCSRNILQVASKEEYKAGKTRKQAGGFIWKFKDNRNEINNIR